MKKLLSLLAAVAFVASASAQIKVQENFESGEYGIIKPWVAEATSIVPATNGSAHMLQSRNGFFYELHQLKTDEIYMITVDAKYLSGEEDNYMVVQGGDPKTKKLVEQARTKLPRAKDFKSAAIKFKVKSPGYHRVVIFPGGTYQFDNIKVEKIEK